MVGDPCFRGLKAWVVFRWLSTLPRIGGLSFPGGQFIQRAEPPTEVEPQARILWAVFVFVFFRHVVLRHFVRAHFSLVRIGRIFHAAHNSRLERLSFF